ncbi:hypothetical protein [Streptomyces monomycini]|uniref:hypothetical protein n=1 Tax=Streptomyces monomycini TaxID=371720 RepID=UPI0004ABC528|nr:hypothetical protein [Streptomyces monomycini]
MQTITALTRTGNEYTLTIALTPRRSRGSVEELPAAVADILRAVGQLRSRNDADPGSTTFDAAADLLEHIAGTWDQQDDQTRQHALALALSLIL